MSELFDIRLDKIQPSQLYIDADKLDSLRDVVTDGKSGNIEPVPVKMLGGEIIYTDGHTRALVAYMAGLQSIKVYWDEDKLDWKSYSICVQWCRQSGIRSIADLQDRVISSSKFEELWIKRCEKLSTHRSSRSELNREP